MPFGAIIERGYPLLGSALGVTIELGYPLLGSVLLVGFWVPVTVPNRSNLREERFLSVQGSLW